MKYQKELEEKLYGQPVLDEWPEVDPDTGKYYDIEAQMLYEGFVAGIESGVKKKEPTLLELVGEWRKSDISDEELLNKILIQADARQWAKIDHRQLDSSCLPRFKYIDLMSDIGQISIRFNTEDHPIGTFEQMNRSTYWRPSAIQD